MYHMFSNNEEERILVINDSDKLNYTGGWLPSKVDVIGTLRG